MRTGAISLFLVIFSALAGVYISRNLFPKVIEKKIIRTVLEQATPEIIERVRYDTTTITKWKTRVLYRTLKPEQVIEIPEIELDTLNWAILAVSKTGQSVTVDTYHIPTTKLLSSTFRVRNDYRLSINQYRTTDPLVILESRNLTDIIPHIYLGYNSRNGPEISLRDQRIWKLYLNWMADSNGFSGTAFVKIK